MPIVLACNVCTVHIRRDVIFFSFLPFLSFYNRIEKDDQGGRIKAQAGVG